MPQLARLVVLAILLPLITLVSHAAVTDAVDEILAQSAAAAGGDAMRKSIEAADAAMARVGAEARQKGADAGALLSARARMAEGLKQAAEFEVNGDKLEALRMLARVRTLSAALAESEPHDGKGASALDKVTKAIYERMRRLGEPKTGDHPGYAVQAGERLITRVFSSEPGQLAVFELVGNDAKLSADWRQTKLAPVDTRLLASLRALKPAKPAEGKSAGGEPVFAFVIGPGGAPATAAQAVALAKALQPISSEFSLPVVIEPATSQRPIEGLPSLPALESGGEALKAEALLIELESGSVVASWPMAGPGRVSAAAVGDAQALARAVAVNLQKDNRPAISVADYVRAPAAVAAEKDNPIYRAVVTQREAALVASDGFKTIKPWFALQETARLGAWSKFAIVGAAGDVWLRPSDTATYIEFPEAITNDGWFAKLMGSRDADPIESASLKAGGELLARPYGVAVVLRKLNAKQELEVIYHQPKELTPATKPRYSFVRADGQLGWVASTNLVPVTAGEPKDAGAAQATTAGEKAVKEKPQPDKPAAEKKSERKSAAGAK